MQRIAVIDYGMGNLRSVSKALELVAPGADVIVTADSSIIGSADRVVCPGQGAAADCMKALQAANLTSVIVEAVSSRPFLGICMGLQVMLSASEENLGVGCLNVIPGTVKRFANPLLSRTGERFKVPHMGWSKVEQTHSHALWHGIDNDARFYFAHSYYCVPVDQSVSFGVCDYGHEFTVTLAKANLFACQFHPEKSSKDGLRLLANFTQWAGSE